MPLFSFKPVKKFDTATEGIDLIYLDRKKKKATSERDESKNAIRSLRCNISQDPHLMTCYESLDHRTELKLSNSPTWFLDLKKGGFIFLEKNRENITISEWILRKENCKDFRQNNKASSFSAPAISIAESSNFVMAQYR